MGWVDVVEVMEVVGCRCVVGVGATCWAWWVGGLVVFGGLWWALVGCGGGKDEGERDLRLSCWGRV